MSCETDCKPHADIPTHTQTPHSCTTGEKNGEQQQREERAKKKNRDALILQHVEHSPRWPLFVQCLMGGGGLNGGVARLSVRLRTLNVAHSLTHTPTLKFRNSQLFLLLAILLAVYALALPSLVPAAAQRKGEEGAICSTHHKFTLLSSDKKLVHIYKR